MKKGTKTLLLLSVLGVMAMGSLTGCGNNKPSNNPVETTKDWRDEKEYTYNTYVSVSPSNWNELTYQDNNDTAIMSYIQSSFFGYDYKFDEKGEIIPGDFVVSYEAATKLEDVSDKYVGEKWGIEAGAKNRAFKITLRNDLKWDDGTPIHAKDFVYSMKEQLNPLFKNYRADSFYVGSTIIHNAQNYVYQGSTEIIEACDEVESLEGLEKNASGVYMSNGYPLMIALTKGLSYMDGSSITDYKAYLDADAYASLKALADDNGNVALTDATYELLLKLIDTEDWGYETADDAHNYYVRENVFEEMDFADVGLFVGDTEDELVLVLDNPLALLNDDGSLSFKAAYNMASLPLVKESLYEQNKVAPEGEGALWTTKYNTSVATTASWGPYKLTSFQEGKQFVLERNTNWYGYQEGLNDGKLQTDKIVSETIAEWNTAWLAFQQGTIDGIGIDVSIASDYKNSERAYYTPDDYVGSLQLQSNAEQLKARESEGVNKTILANAKFRKALSLAFNRSEFAQQCTTASKAGFGLFNSMHYYDVEHGKTYRGEDPAKKVLCDVYNVDVKDYSSIDEAEKSITGYDLKEAQKLITEAYNEELAAGNIKATDVVKLTFDTGAINEATTRQFNKIKEMWQAACVGTPLENRLEMELQDFAANWATDFRKGLADVCMGGWSGAAWDPGYFLLAYLSPAYMYSQAWDTSSQMLTFDCGDGSGEHTMSLMDWYNCLNGAAGAPYNWAEGAVANDIRLNIIAALEGEVLKTYYVLPLYNYFSASMLSYKVDYISYDYNTFMGYGGVTYMTYNYDDASWAEYVSSNGGTLDYKG